MEEGSRLNNLDVFFMISNFNPETCKNITKFKKTLSAMRKIDDNIHSNLNALPNESSPQFPERCNQFKALLMENYNTRDSIIETCLQNSDSNLKDAIAREKSVDAIIRETSWKLFNEKCG